jgi:hypothetical protein
LKRHFWIISALALLMLLSGSIMVSAEQTPNDEAAPARTHIIGHFGPLPLHDIHRQTYLTLLVEKYAPNTLPQWETVLEESERLVAELRALTEVSALKSYYTIANIDPNDGLVIAHKLRERDDNEHQVRREEFVEQIGEDVVKVTSRIDVFSNSWSDLGEALAEQDEDGIRHALEQLYAEYLERNENLQQQLEDFKTQAAESAD